MQFSESFAQWLNVYKDAIARGLDRGDASDLADSRLVPARVARRRYMAADDYNNYWQGGESAVRNSDSYMDD